MQKMMTGNHPQDLQDHHLAVTEAVVPEGVLLEIGIEIILLEKKETKIFYFYETVPQGAVSGYKR